MPTLQSRGYLSKLKGLHSIQKLAIPAVMKRMMLKQTRRRGLYFVQELPKPVVSKSGLPTTRGAGLSVHLVLLYRLLALTESLSDWWVLSTSSWRNYLHLPWELRVQSQRCWLVTNVTSHPMWSRLSLPHGQRETQYINDMIVLDKFHQSCHSLHRDAKLQLASFLHTMSFHGTLGTLFLRGWPREQSHHIKNSWHILASSFHMGFCLFFFSLRQMKNQREGRMLGFYISQWKTLQPLKKKLYFSWLKQR